MTKKQLNFIISQGEGQFIEFKEKLDKNFPKEITAFANAQGGRIYLGITDMRVIKGITITNDLKSKITDTAHNCDPQIKLHLKTYQNILIVDVPESINKPHSCSSGFYLRSEPFMLKNLGPVSSVFGMR